MSRSVHCPSGRYAVIEASSNKDHPEHLVIAYPDEKCLRDLIAAPSILNLGFASREQAMARLAIEMRGSTVSRQRPRTTELSRARQEHAGSAKWLTLLKNGTPHRVLQYTLSTIVFVFYSKNLFSTVIRVVLGASS